MNGLQVEPDAAMIDLVAFKWLMAGRGVWVDLSRFRQDAAYARQCLRYAAESGLELLVRHSAALRARLPQLSPQPTLQAD